MTSILRPGAVAAREGADGYMAGLQQPLKRQTEWPRPKITLEPPMISLLSVCGTGHIRNGNILWVCERPGAYIARPRVMFCDCKLQTFMEYF